MYGMKKDLSQYESKDFAAAAEYIRNLPRQERELIIQELTAQIRAGRSLFSRVKTDNIYEFRGIIYAGGMNGR